MIEGGGGWTDGHAGGRPGYAGTLGAAGGMRARWGGGRGYAGTLGGGRASSG
jgi:hypothetical protein